MPPQEPPAVDVDLLVIGAGMAGMTAAAYGAGRGLCVGVVEKAPEIGGTARLSSGGLAKPRSAEALKCANPGADPAFADLLFGRYDEVLAWIASLGAGVTPASDVEEVLGIPATVRGLDIHSYLDLCRLEVESAGGWVVTNAIVERLEVRRDAIAGAVVRDRDGTTLVRSPATLLATGGFQGSPEYRRRFLGQHAESLLVRANPQSVGDGLGLALSAGGTTTASTQRFYGHAVPAPLNHDFTARDFTRLSMPFLVTRGLLLDRQGHRFVDESQGYYSDARAVMRVGGRALFVGDQRLRDAGAAGDATNRALGIEVVDRVTEAARSGANVCEGKSLQDLDEIAAGWGFRNIAAAVAAFNRAAESGAQTAPPRLRHRGPFAAPFFAIEVQAAITFPFDGIKVDAAARVLRADGGVVEGLFAAGADAGGYFCEQYCSGLAMAAVLATTVVDGVLAKRGA